MTHRLEWALLAALLFVGLTSAAPRSPMPVPAPRPIRGATTQPGPASSQPTPVAALPADFQILQTRNPFASGKAGPGGAHGGPGGPGAPGGPETLFVLKGIAEIDGKATAFVEDATSKQMMPLTAGSALPIGRVNSVDIDSIQFEAAGASARRIAVGQNFAGQVVPPTPAPKPAPAQPAPGGPGAPGGGPPGGPGGPMPPGVKGRPGRAAPPEQEAEAAPAAAPNQ